MPIRVSVFGLGYVGCVTSACLAKAGHQVIGVDVKEQKVAMVNRGESPIVEEGLGDLLRDVVSAGRLTATTETDVAIRGSDVALVCVGTPSRPNGQLDVDGVARIGLAIGAALKGRVDPFSI